MAQYGRWIDIDGNLHYFDTENGEVVEYKEKEPEVEYKIYVDPMPTNCYDCPMLVANWSGDLKDYCHLDCNCSIDVYWDCREFNEGTQTYTLKRPDNCPLSTYFAIIQKGEIDCGKFSSQIQTKNI